MKEERASLRPAEAARALSISRATLYRWERKGIIRITHIEGCALVPMSEIQRLTSPGAQTPVVG